MDRFYYAQYGLEQGCHMESSLSVLYHNKFCNSGYVGGNIWVTVGFTMILTRVMALGFLLKIENTGVTECT